LQLEFERDWIAFPIRVWQIELTFGKRNQELVGWKLETKRVTLSTEKGKRWFSWWIIWMCWSNKLTWDRDWI